MNNEEEKNTYKLIKEYLKSKNLLAKNGSILDRKKYCKLGTYHCKRKFNKLCYSGTIINSLNILTIKEITMIMNNGSTIHSISTKNNDGSFKIIILKNK